MGRDINKHKFRSLPGNVFFRYGNKLEVNKILPKDINPTVKGHVSIYKARATRKINDL